MFFHKYKKLFLAAMFGLTVTAVSAISICKGTGSTGGGSTDFPVDKTFVMSIRTPTDRTFSFQISASGNYKIDWGDGSAVETITKTNTTLTTYSHTFPAASTNYTAKLSGLATGYNSSETIAAITFDSTNPKANLVGIAGNLGYIFPILNTTSTGSPTFFGSFSSCTEITGIIPENLFTGINGTPVSRMFANLFWGCTGLTGQIPSTLFSGISGVPAYHMFGGTFQGCTGLTGAIPSELFAGISGAPAEGMFMATFLGCTGLTSIPIGLFGNLSGDPKSNMFSYTFTGCTGLTGQSALMPDGVTHLYEQWPSATTSHVQIMYSSATGLSDYASIPAAWK